ncbi:MAG: acetate--CoA ligase family protein [Patescibacteria group bacterium]
MLPNPANHNNVLDKLFYPSSITVVGASSNTQKVGNIVLRNILDSGYKGALYPVNPSTQTILDLKCYSNIASLPGTPDLAVVAIPSTGVNKLLEELSEKNIRNIVIFSAGYKEIGPEGVLLEKQLLESAKLYDLNILGPNCLGFVNNSHNLNATFGKVNAPQGPLNFISQSGAIASSFFDWAAECDLGFNQFITLGNKTVLSENNILEYWLSKFYMQYSQDFFESAKLPSKLSPIGMYLESIVNGQEFVKLVSRITPFNPVFILKPGKTEQSKKAMQSHTGALAGEDNVLETALSTANVIRCQGMEDMFDYSKAFSWSYVPSGNNVAIISNAGGPAVITSDFVAENGLNLVDLSADTKKLLTTQLPRAASILNPVDVLGDALADRYKIALTSVLEDSAVDSVILILTPQVMTQAEQTAQLIGNLAHHYKKPIFCAFVGGAQVEHAIKLLDQYKVPSFSYPGRAVNCLAQLSNWALRANTMRDNLLNEQVTSIFVSKPKINFDTATSILEQAMSRQAPALTSVESSLLLSSIDLFTPPIKVVENSQHAVDFVANHGWPVVLKLSSEGLLHKSDVGGVITNIRSTKELAYGYEAILGSKRKLIDSTGDNLIEVVIQKQVEDGLELIIGVKKDPNFGAVLMFGAGGVMAELIDDTNLLLLPSTDYAGLVARSKVHKILAGYRGDAAYHLDPLYAVMERLAALALNFEFIKEIEINPLILTPTHAWAVDGKVVL